MTGFAMPAILTKYRGLGLLSRIGASHQDYTSYGYRCDGVRSFQVNGCARALEE